MKPELLYENIITSEPVKNSESQEWTSLKMMLSKLNSKATIFDEHAIVSVTDLNGIITYVNNKFCQISGYSREELIGQKHCIIKSEDNSDEMYSELWQTISNGEVWQGEIKNCKKNGDTYWVESTIAPCLNSQGKPNQYISLKNDITEHKNTQKALRKSHTELSIKNKALQAELILHQHTIKALEEAKNTAEYATNCKTEFLAHMSHELRTPLNAIIGYSQLIQSEIHGPFGNNKYKEYVDNINLSGSHLHNLIGDILDISTIASGNFELNTADFCFNEMISTCVHIIQGQVDNGGLKLTSAFTHNPINFHGDELHIRQIVLNLLANAIKFTPKGGQINMRINLKSSGVVELIIADNGIGISSDNIQKALEPFGQVRDGSDIAFQGTGLGLPLTKSLVELHNGSFSIDSELGKGTTVTIELQPVKTLSSSNAI